MIPAFDDIGYLPAGVHPATLWEVEERFGVSSELRRAQMDSLRWMIELAKRAGVLRIILNGSFVTDIIEPNDVDCLLLLGIPSPQEETAIQELSMGLPFLEMKLVQPVEFDDFTGDIFATDRMGVRKGMIEVVQWH
jgi:hypothetical protein